MSYQVLARKWRPRTFEEMVGQGHVVRALVNALDHDRLHHAFLFTGTRGVGKTTVARILAKSLNCEEGVSSRPCGECGTCRELAEGRFVDLVEVDAASRTKVEDTRELLENVQYTPTRGRYKVYLVDEVHMLSTHSFNALLKTLEEPPDHVKFLLATTDPQRLPVTILSRCLQFNLKRLPPEMIRDQLDQITAAEGIDSDPSALLALAHAADGSMRDALSLLDQAVAFGSGRVSEAEVAAMLGTVGRGQLTSVLEAVAGGDGDAVLAQVAELADYAPDFDGVLAALLSLLHRLAVYQLVPSAVSDDDKVLAGLAQQISPEDVQLYYQIALTGRRDLPQVPDPRSGLEMVLLRMLAFRPVDATSQTALTASRSSQLPAGAPVQPGQSTPAAEHPGEWPQLVERMGLSGVLQQLAVNCVLKQRDGHTFYLAIAPQHASLRSSQLEERLRQALAEVTNKEVKLVISVEEVDQASPAEYQARQAEDRLQAVQAAIEQDEHVKGFKETFDARVVPDSVRPAE